VKLGQIMATDFRHVWAQQTSSKRSLCYGKVMHCHEQLQWQVALRQMVQTQPRPASVSDYEENTERVAWRVGDHMTLGETIRFGNAWHSIHKSSWRAQI